ncbi:type IX secretion/gliding motility protein PorT/SprT [Dinghuibacter silviterrae]|nr:outer membrane beta-barrel protein [Dinghuibacter silviterrae]
MLRNILLTTLGCLCIWNGLHAQLFEPNMPDHDSKPYYFGITLSYNTAHFKAASSPRMMNYDSVLLAQAKSVGGFGLGLLGTLKLIPHFELRFNPQLIFANRDIAYHIKYPVYPEDSTSIKQVQSALLSFPLDLKFLSDRIGNFRVYTFVGLKWDYDLASNSANRKVEDLVKVKPSDAGFNLGFGVNFFFPSFIFSPEIRFTNGFGNVLSQDPTNKYSNVIESLKTRMVMFCIHLEG